ncbi:phosphoenolpyruvate--protein phosphotransferase [Glaciecola petra]|uniref:phosphoenolpyruvate--protein phosphotransferase n=1 Tax=Glaciecola petra TaxID=3075602 RepID=A0ABU2ZS15_9ALTE|nr:phosphoenolpyruvate--protein phosphotransferase [Aestuariibacter sp. P117]MDT0595427.1 phosphoenolpyruvate--protein phosphotransferase [Aestuariibacter sp. P117]
MLTNLKQIIQEMNSIHQLDAALSHLATRVKTLMEVDSCSIYLANYETKQLSLAATDGLEKSAVGKVKIGFYEGLVGLVGDREEPINIENAKEHPRYKHFPEVKEDNYHAFLGTPIINQRKVLGVISMQQKNIRRFSEDEEAFLVTLAAQIALEIVNAEMLGAFDQENQGHEKESRQVNGIPGSPGLALGIGIAYNLKHKLNQWVPKKSSDTSSQITRYRTAIEATRLQVATLSASVSDDIPDDVSAIFQLYHQLLDANSLGREVEQKIHEGWDAASSLKLVVDVYAARFESMEDPYMRERAVDIIDLSNRILVNIIDDKQVEFSANDEGAYILVAQEVSAPMLAEFPREKLAGIISIKGSNNSHAAILARALGVPAVMGLHKVSLNLLNQQELFIDGYSGEVTLNISESNKQEYLQLIAQEEALQDKIAAEADNPSITQDDKHVSLLVNAGLSANVEMEQFKQGDGVGLYRTEIPFMMRDRFPSEQEQCDLYKSLLSAHPSKEITMRTLDVGGDKPLSYFPISEENPFLGWRGIRLTLDHPDIFLVQIRAMLRASIGLSNLHILLPMISNIGEVIESKRLIKQAFLEVKEEAFQQGNMLSKPAVGVMLEVPAVIFQIPQLADHVDFFSVGTNDLTQYLLAVDRNNASVSSLYSSYHPSVLNALQKIFDDSIKCNIPVTVCGELAGEPAGALLLLAMGYRKLSMNAHSLRKINWVIRNTSISDTQELLQLLLHQESTEQVINLLEDYLEAKDLGGLVRAGS